MKKQETTKISFDMDAAQHKYIKMLAAKEGISLREYISRALPYPGKKEEQHIDQKEFDKVINEVFNEYSSAFKGLTNR